MRTVFVRPFPAPQTPMGYAMAERELGPGDRFEVKTEGSSLRFSVNGETFAQFLQGLGWIAADENSRLVIDKLVLEVRES